MISSRPTTFLLLLLAACAGTGRESDVRGSLRRGFGYEGREDDGASIAYLEARPALLEALVAPASVEIARALTEDYASPFDPADAAEIVSWAGDPDVRRHLLDPGTRRFARGLVAAGVLDRDSLRIDGGPLWSEAPGILAALADLPGMADLLPALGRDHGYRLRPDDGAHLAAIRRDDDLRRDLARPEVVSGWARVSREARVPFHPGRAREVVVLALAADLPEILRRLRTLEVRMGPGGLAALAGIVEAGRAEDLLSERHVRLLERLRDRPGPPPDLADLPGTLALVDAPGGESALASLERLGWVPRFRDPGEMEAIAALAASERSLARVAARSRPRDAGRGAVLLSVRGLLAEIEEGRETPDPWLDAGDRAFRSRLEDPGVDRTDLERGIVEARGRRAVVARPRTSYEQSDRALPWMSRVDLLRIRRLQVSLEDPGLIRRLIDEAREDRRDATSETGGVIEIVDGAASWRREGSSGSRGPAGDRYHALPSAPDPARVLATYHYHARGGRTVAGPSPGRRTGDLAAARRQEVDGVVVTLLDDGRIDVDFHDAAGHVFDLGVYPGGGEDD